MRVILFVLPVYINIQYRLRITEDMPYISRNSLLYRD